MSRTDPSHLQLWRRLGETKLADIIALTAALIWVGLTVGILSWEADMPFMATLRRALIGAILIYAMAFVGLRIMGHMAKNAAMQAALESKEKPPEKPGEHIDTVITDTEQSTEQPEDQLIDNGSE